MLSELIASTLLSVTPAGPPPNVLLVVLDDVGVDMLASYREGPDPASTPVIDALAQSGVLFRNAWANPICSPSRAEILTGRYGFRTGLGWIVTEEGWALGLSEVTLAERLPADYQCGAFGKWHLSNDDFGGGDLGPNLQGFDRFIGPWGNLGFPQSFSDYEIIVDGVREPSTDYATTRTVDDALGWIQGQSDPWFCYLAFNAPHAPYHEPPSHLHTQQAEVAGLDPRIVPRPFYKAMLEAADTELGRLLTGIAPQKENTLIIVVADNGTPRENSIFPFLPEHAKLTPFEGGVNVPLIISGPGVVQPGREIDALVCATDLFETVAEVTGAPPLEGAPAGYVTDSISLVPLLELDPLAVPRKSVYADLYKSNSPTGFGDVLMVRMIRFGDYKLIRYMLPSSQVLLFNLEQDPFERDNLLKGPFVSSEHQQIATGLMAQMEAITQ